MNAYVPVARELLVARLYPLCLLVCVPVAYFPFAYWSVSPLPIYWSVWNSPEKVDSGSPL
jgi:hypothetical protein